nr:hypothetical protein Ade03nite_70980 [Actinoplanes derwentensis]
MGARLRAVLDDGARRRAVPESGPLEWADIVPAWAAEEEDLSPFGEGPPGGSPPGGFPSSGVLAAGGGGRFGGGSGGSSGEPFGVMPVSGPAYPWDATGAVRAVTPGPVSPAPSSSVVSGGLPGFPGQWEDGEADSGGPGLSSAGAFENGRRQWLDAFDPGRPGVRALAAVAVVVVLVAAFLAWRSRPRLDDVVADPGGTVTAVIGASGAVQTPVPSVVEVVVAVGGKVRRPGLVRLSPGARVADALEAAGGAEPGVDVAMLNLARRVTDGELIMVGVTPPPGTTTGPAAGTGAPGTGGSLVNLNTATLTDLDGLPGVGPVLAQRILDARESQGGFKAVSDLRKVDGIGDSRYEQLKDLVTI